MSKESDARRYAANREEINARARKKYAENPHDRGARGGEIVSSPLVHLYSQRCSPAASHDIKRVQDVKP
jgi:hypothetical protein